MSAHPTHARTRTHTHQHAGAMPVSLPVCVTRQLPQAGERSGEKGRERVRHWSYTCPLLSRARAAAYRRLACLLPSAQLQLRAYLLAMQAQGVPCSVYFTVAVTEDGELLARGDGRQGQLGLGAVLHQQQLACAGGPELFGNQRIRLAAAGFRHLAVEDGAVYTCGSGLDGRLGIGDAQPRRLRKRYGPARAWATRQTGWGVRRCLRRARS
jgi:hypothetical protein